MMKLGIADYKEIAKGSLAGHRGSAAGTMILGWFLGLFSDSPLSLGVLGGVITAVYLYMDGTLTSLMLLFLITAAILLYHFYVGGIIRLGYVDYNLALLDRRRAGPGMLFIHSDQWYITIVVKVLLTLLLGFGYMLFIIPGIIWSLNYSMVYYIIEEKPEFTAIHAMRMSRKIMAGNRWRYLYLQLSFIPWYILGFLTCGLAFLYVIPYKSLTEAVFYNEISGRADIYYGRKKKGQA